MAMAFCFSELPCSSPKLRGPQDGKWVPVVVMGGFASVDSNQLSVLCNDFEVP